MKLLRFWGLSVIEATVTFTNIELGTKSGVLSKSKSATLTIFAFLAMDSGKINIEIWKDKDPCHSVANHLVKPWSHEELKNKLKTKCMGLGWQIECSLKQVDCHWLCLAGFSKKELCLSKNLLVCRQRWESTQNRSVRPWNTVGVSCFYMLPAHRDRNSRNEKGLLKTRLCGKGLFKVGGFPPRFDDLLSRTATR